ncbi:MAG: hypothetical protein J2P41_10105 [Blastocatellia bacterium]|nr:hypothetical protein [Blastocatellia bacterium]
MAHEDINYAKEVLASEYNLAFIGLMLFLMIVVNFLGFLPLLLAGEIGALLIAQNTRVQRIIRARKNKDKKLEAQEVEAALINSLPNSYQADFNSLGRLCDEIERRAGELRDTGAQTLLSGMIDKLALFRSNYARMLRAHHTLSTRNYRNIEQGLNREVERVEKSIGGERSAQVRRALEQNLDVLKQRLERVRKLDELVRLLEARLQVTRNSLGLIQDEVYSFTDVAGISSLVDSMLTNLSISDEFRTAYENFLNEEGLEKHLLGPGELNVATAGSETEARHVPQRVSRRE